MVLNSYTLKSNKPQQKTRHTSTPCQRFSISGQTGPSNIIDTLSPSANSTVPAGISIIQLQPHMELSTPEE